MVLCCLETEVVLSRSVEKVDRDFDLTYGSQLPFMVETVLTGYG